MGVTHLALLQETNWYVVERRRGQVEFSSDRAPQYPPPQAGGPAEHQRQGGDAEEAAVSDNSLKLHFV